MTASRAKADAMPEDWQTSQGFGGRDRCNHNGAVPGARTSKSAVDGSWGWRRKLNGNSYCEESLKAGSS